jgi:hypothetical protein
MLFFRSEEAIDAWCQANRQPRRPTATIAQLWELSKAWYGNRLSPDARRPQPDEVRRIFATVGLEGPFWDPGGDRFSE